MTANSESRRREYFHSAFTIELIDSWEQLQLLRNVWNHLLLDSVHPSVFLSFEYLTNAWWHFHRDSSRLYVLVLRSADHEIVGIAPFRISEWRRVFRYRIVEFLATFEMDKPYIIVSRNWEEPCWKGILAYLKSQRADWNLIDLAEMPNSLAGARVLSRGFGGPRYRLESMPDREGPVVDLQVKWEEFQRKHKNFRKRLRQLDKLPQGYQIVTYSSPKDMPRAIDEYVELERVSWKSGSIGVNKDGRHLAVYKDAVTALAASGNAQVRFLMTGEQFIAGDISYNFGETVYFHHAVYNQAFARYSPGTLFTGLVIRDYLQREEKIGDFLCGFADYLKPWSSGVVETTRVRIQELSLSTVGYLLIEKLVGLVDSFRPGRRSSSGGVRVHD